VPAPDEPEDDAFAPVPGVLDMPGLLEPGVSWLWLLEGIPAAVQGFVGLPFGPFVIDVPLVDELPLFGEVPLLVALPVPLVPDVPVPLLPDAAPGLAVPLAPEAPPAAPPLAPAAPPPAPPAAPPAPAANALLVPAANAAAAKMTIRVRVMRVSGMLESVFCTYESQRHGHRSVPSPF
jgi:pyruvate/2-oxoglutarate dehydrogenase complex dihydrolipoamide acyltransferase (E2) component